MNTFAFLIHPLKVSDFTRKFPWLGALPDGFVEAMMAQIPPFTASAIRGVQSATGAETEGSFIALPMTPRRVLQTPWPKVRARLIRAGRKAEEKGAAIFGLGAFTKIVGDRGLSVADALSIGVTTGNSYTAATAVEGALLGAERLGVPIEDATAVVIGATGAIGRAVSLLLAENVRRMTIVGRDEERLLRLKKEIEGEGSAEVSVSTSPRAAAATADVVLTVSSATETLLEPGDLLPGAVVCDVARPRNVSARVYEERSDVLVIDGGVIRVPGPVDFGFDFGFPKGCAEACMAETMILALEGETGDYTLGQTIDVAKVRHIHALGRKHGFEVAGFRRFERAISDDEVEAIRGAALKNGARLRPVGD